MTDAAPDDAPIQGGQSNIVVHGYTIEGIDAGIDAIGREHVNVFYNKVVAEMNESGQSWRLMPREKYERMREALYQISKGATAKDLKKTYPQVYKWQKAYCVTGDEDSLVLLKRPSNVGVDGTVDINTLKRMTYLERVYSDIQRNHVVDHSKGRTLHSRIFEVIDNISKEVCKIFTDSCPLCVERQARTKPVAGLKPIITSGFGKRGQVDLIDFQSMPDGSFNFHLRKRAAEKMQKSALAMIKTARKSYGNDKPFDVGTVVHVPLNDVDRTKVDSGNLIGIIVKVDKTKSQARVAVQGGLLKSWYVYHKLDIVKGAGNNPSLFGLSLVGWEDLKVITEREAARQVSLVGGQGKGLFTCMCKGNCNSNHCSCFKNKRICGSACHRNNFKCSNHDSHGQDQDMFLPDRAHVNKTNK